MSSTFHQFRSEPTLFAMSSQSKVNHAIESKQCITNTYTQSTHTDSSKVSPFQPPSNDQKIHLKSTNRSQNHQVSVDNWRIRYYMNLNLVKQDPSSLMQYRSSSLPDTHSDTDTHSHTQSRKSIEKTQHIATHKSNIENAVRNHTKLRNKSKKRRPNSHILGIGKTRSQNNTPPYHSLMRKSKNINKSHRTHSRLSRMRSRSDGLLSFHQRSTSISTQNSDSTHSTNNGIDLDIDDDNESISIEYDTNSHTPKAQKIRLPKHLPHQRGSNGALQYQSSRTPPGNGRMSVGHHRMRYTSEPISIRAQKRSKPLVINKKKLKPREYVDFNLPPTSFHASPNSNLFHGMSSDNIDSLVDDEANFELE